MIDNFDAKAPAAKDHYRILIATEVLSEGVNLHASNVVINYDIPWNPTRLRQRVGRINRVDTKFNKIYTFNFFPTKQANEQIKLQEAAEAKIEAFISLLGADAKLLTDGEEPESHELFHRLTSKSTITDEDGEAESELKYQLIIKDIRDKDPDLFNRIKKLPKKARTARKHKDNQNALLTYFRKGKLHKFFLSGADDSKELDFVSAAKLLEVKPKTKREKVDADYYKLLDKNKQEFVYATTEELIEPHRRSGRDSSAHVLKVLKVMRKDVRQLTDDQEDYLKKVISQFEKGAIPKETAKKLNKALKEELKKGSATLKLMAVIQKGLPPKFLEEHMSETAAQTKGPREVILSEYLIGV